MARSRKQTPIAGPVLAARPVTSAAFQTFKVEWLLMTALHFGWGTVVKATYPGMFKRDLLPAAMAAAAATNKWVDPIAHPWHVSRSQASAVLDACGIDLKRIPAPTASPVVTKHIAADGSIQPGKPRGSKSHKPDCGCPFCQSRRNKAAAAVQVAEAAVQVAPPADSLAAPADQLAAILSTMQAQNTAILAALARLTK